MSTATSTIQELANREYKYGFVTDIEADAVPPGLNEDIVRLISAKKKRAGLAARVAAEGVPPLADDGGAALVAERHVPADRLPGHHLLLRPEAEEAAQQPRRSRSRSCGATFEKLGISLDEQKRLSGVAVDAVFDSVSVATTFKDKLAELGIIFCSFSEAVHESSRAGARSTSARWCRTTTTFRRPELGGLQRRLVLLHPQGRALPDGAVDLFPHQRQGAPGQFERTLIVAEEGGYVSYLEGCTAPMRDENQLHAAVVELVARRRRRRRSSTRPCRTGIPATRKARAASTTS